MPFGKLESEKIAENFLEDSPKNLFIQIVVHLMFMGYG